MSDQPIPTPADIAPKASEPSPEPAAAAPADTPPWGEDFDPNRAWSKIQALTKDLEKAKADKTPQAEKDARAIAELRRKLDDAAPKLAEFERLEQASKTELERAQEAAGKNAERAQALLNRAVNAEIKALAGDFADPSDAAAFLDTSKYATAEGDVDTESIATDLANLLARKPHLGKSPTSRVPAPNPAQGSSGSGPTPSLTPEQQIVALEKEGKFAEANAIKADLLMDYRRAQGL